MRDVAKIALGIVTGIGGFLDAGIVRVLRTGRPPRVTSIEIGLPTVLARIHPRLGAWAARLERRLWIRWTCRTRIDRG